MQRPQVDAAAGRAIAGLADQRVQLHLLVGAERHLGFAERREQPGERARLAMRQLPEGADGLERLLGALRIRVGCDLRERLGGPVDGDAQGENVSTTGGSMNNLLESSQQLVILEKTLPAPDTARIARSAAYPFGENAAQLR